MTEIRDADKSEIDVLAELWRNGWLDAHAEILPAGFIRLRTPESFPERMALLISGVRAAGPVGSPLGFHFVRGDELNQLYLAPAARGTGLAAILMADAETRLAASGVERVWLSCAIGNDRAARFYEKSGWERTGVVTDHLETAGGPYDLDVWRYEKVLTITN